MKLFPEFHMGVFNGWIPLVLYFLGFIVSVSLYSGESKTWLFNNPKDEKNKILLAIRLAGQAAAIALIVVLVFTPLSTHFVLFWGGAVIFSIGFIFVMTALYSFRITPVGQPVVKGPYRLSRNPQWVGLFLVLLGSSVAAGVWLYIGLVALVGIVYHIQILAEEKLCLEKYGDSYRTYMSRVPRYLVF